MVPRVPTCATRYLHRTMLTLFRIVTFEDWTDVMYTSMYGCELWGYGDDDSLPHPKLCKGFGRGGGGSTYVVFNQKLGWLVAFFFLTFVFFGALVLLTLFIGVVQVILQALRAH